jgi:glucosyl-3-phosphoglycerate synthase
VDLGKVVTNRRERVDPITAARTAKCSGGSVHERAEEWYARRTYEWWRWDPVELLRRKGESRVSVVLPARNEQRTVGDIVTVLRRELVEALPLVDELVVIDSGSTDATAAVAAAAGAHVVPIGDILPEVGDIPGKGEALWKSQFVTTGDIIVFLDADVLDVGPHFVYGLLGPLLDEPEVALVKAFYDRPAITGEGVRPTGGGRVTELVARPLLNLYWPELAGVIQPLAGEYAARRSVLARLPFASGYGVEMGLLLDIARTAGLHAIAQVDLGRREHSHQADDDLALMTATIMHVALSRLSCGPVMPDFPHLTQFHRGEDRHTPVTRPVEFRERPPGDSVPAAWREGCFARRGVAR